MWNISTLRVPDRAEPFDVSASIDRTAASPSIGSLLLNVFAAGRETDQISAVETGPFNTIGGGGWLLTGKSSLAAGPVSQKIVNRESLVMK